MKITTILYSLIIISFIFSIFLQIFLLEQENNRLRKFSNECISYYSSCVGDLKGCANQLRVADDNTEFIYKLLKRDSR